MEVLNQKHLSWPSFYHSTPVQTRLRICPNFTSATFLNEGLWTKSIAKEENFLLKEQKDYSKDQRLFFFFFFTNVFTRHFWATTIGYILFYDIDKSGGTLHSWVLVFWIIIIISMLYVCMLYSCFAMWTFLFKNSYLWPRFYLLDPSSFEWSAICLKTMRRAPPMDIWTWG